MKMLVFYVNVISKKKKRTGNFHFTLNIDCQNMWATLCGSWANNNSLAGRKMLLVWVNELKDYYWWFRLSFLTNYWVFCFPKFSFFYLKKLKWCLPPSNEKLSLEILCKIWRAWWRWPKSSTTSWQTKVSYNLAY